MTEQAHKRMVFGANVTSNATADILLQAAASPIEVYKFGYITEAAIDPDAGGFVVQLVHQPIAGSAVGEVVVASITRADADLIGAGKVVWQDVILPVAQANGDDTLQGGPTAQTSLIDVGPAGPLHVFPGGAAVVRISNASGVAVDITPFMDMAELGFEPFHANMIQDQA